MTLAREVEVARQELADLLGVAALGERREPDEVGEQDRDEPALGDRARAAVRGAAAGRRWRPPGSRHRRRSSAVAAVAAEPRGRAVRGAAGRAERDQAVAAFGAELPPGLVRRSAGGTVHGRNVPCAMHPVPVASAPAVSPGRAPGSRRPTPRTRPAAAPGPPRRRRRRRARAGRSPTAPAGSARSSRRRPAYSSDSVMSETVVSSVLSVTGTPARWSRASGCAATDGTIPACQFEVGHRSRRHAARRSARRTAPGRRRRPVRARSAPARPRARGGPGRAAPLAGVERDPQAARRGPPRTPRRGSADPG